MRRRVALILLGPLICFALAACSRAAHVNDEPERPVRADAQLFEEIRALPGVTSAEIHWVDTFNARNSYMGAVRVTPATDPVQTYDKVMRILLQGRPGAAEAGSIGVSVPGGTMVTGVTLDLYEHSDWLKRYGAAAEQ